MDTHSMSDPAPRARPRRDGLASQSIRNDQQDQKHILGTVKRQYFMSVIINEA